MRMLDVPLEKWERNCTHHFLETEKTQEPMKRCSFSLAPEKWKLKPQWDAITQLSEYLIKKNYITHWWWLHEQQNLGHSCRDVNR